MLNSCYSNRSKGICRNLFYFSAIEFYTKIYGVLVMLVLRVCVCICVEYRCVDVSMI